MAKTYPTQDRLKALYSFDEVRNRFIYLEAPYRKPHLKGCAAGRMDKRDGIFYVPVDGNQFELKKLISIFKTGALPPGPPHHSQLTQEYVKSALHYDPDTGIFVRLQSAGGAKAGSRADYVENNGYRYVVLNGKRMIAARLAWFYVHGEWPKGRVIVGDGNSENIALSNLSLAEWGNQKDSAIKRAYDKAHRQRNPGWHRGYNLKRDFGISLDQYQAAFVEQAGVCACCRKAETDHRDGKRKWLAVDHDHKDGSFRGLLCQNCNNMLGRAKDDPEILENAAAYLRAHATKPKTNVVPLIGRRIANSRGENE